MKYPGDGCRWQRSYLGLGMQMIFDDGATANDVMQSSFLGRVLSGSIVCIEHYGHT